MLDLAIIGVGFDTTGLKKGTAALKETEHAANKTADAADKTSKSANAASNSFGSLKAVLSTLGLGLVMKEFIQIADQMSLMDARLKIATGSGAEFARSQAEIYKIAQSNNVGLKETTQLYTKLADPIKALGGNTKHVAGIVDAFATSMRVGGASAQEASAATLQFAQAMGSGKLSGDEFRSMAEASPRFMKALAEGMGVPTGALKEMSTEGKLTADIVGNALLKSLSKLKDEAKSIPDTVGGSFTRIKNDIEVAINEINKSTGLTLGVAGVADELGKIIPAVQNELTSAFSDVQQWIERNKKDLGDVYETVKSLVVEAYGVGKAFVSVIGAVIEVGLHFDIFKNAIETARLLIAGLTDGVTFLGGVFATIGSIILKSVLTPITYVMNGVASLMDATGNEGLAGSLRQSAASLKDFAGAGAKYGDGVVDSFGRGDSAVARLNASLEKASKTANAVKAGIKGSYDGYTTGGTTGFSPLKGLPAKADGASTRAPQISEYTRMAEAINKVIASQQQELEYGGKLSASDKFRLDEMQKINFALQTKKIKQLESVQLIGLLTTAVQKMVEVEKQAYITDAIKKNNEALDKYHASLIGGVEALIASNEQQRLDNELIGLSTEQTNKLTLDRQDAAIALKELALAGAQNNGADEASIALMQREIALLQTKRALTNAGQTSLAAVEAQKLSEEAAKKYEKEQVDIWKQIDSTAESVFMDIAKNGTSAFKGLEEELKNGLLKLLYEMTVKKWIISIGSDLTGLDLGSLLGGGSGGGLGNMLFGKGVDLLSGLFGGGSAAAATGASATFGAVTGTAGTYGMTAAAGTGAAALAELSTAAVTLGSSATVATAGTVAAGTGLSGLGSAALAALGPVGLFAVGVGALFAIFGFGKDKIPTVLNDLSLFNNSLIGLPFLELSLSSDEAAQGLRDVLYGLDNATPTMRKLAGETINLSKELLVASGDIAGARNLARNLDTRGMSEGEIAVYDYNEKLRDQIQAHRDAAAAASAGASAAQAAKAAEDQLAQTRYNLAGKLNVLLGRTTQLEFDRATALAATTDEGSIAMLTLTHQLEDMYSAVDANYARLERSIAAEKKLVDVRLKTATDLQSALKTAKDAISPALDRASAQSQIAMYVALAKAGGVLPSAAALKPALDAIAKPSTDLFTTFEEYAVDQARTANDIGDLAGYADKQVSMEQQTLDRLDGTLETAKNQLDILKGVDNSITTAAAADAAFYASMLALTAAKAGAANYNYAPPAAASSGGGGGGGGYYGGAASGSAAGQYEAIAGQDNADIVAAYRAYYSRNPDASGYDYFAKSNLAGDALTQAILRASSGDVNGADYQKAVANGYDPMNPLAKYYKSKNKSSSGAVVDDFGSFAVGSNYIPNDMIAQIHKGEEITPRPYVDLQRASREESNALMARLVASNERLEQKVESLQKATDKTAANTGKTADTLQGKQGVPFLVEIAQ